MGDEETHAASTRDNSTRRTQPRAGTTPDSRPPWRDKSILFTIIAAPTLIALATAILNLGVPWVTEKFSDHDAQPLVTASSTLGGCAWHYTPMNISNANDEDQQRLISPRAGTDTTYAAIQRGNDGVALTVTLQTASKEAILITGVRFNFTQKRTVPNRGSLYNPGGCGGGVTVRPFSVGLDYAPPTLKALPGVSDDGSPLPPLKFPFKISASDPESFEFRLNSELNYYEFTLEVDWRAPGQAGKTVVDDSGKAFRIMGKGNLPIYALNKDGKLQLEAASSGE